MARPARRKDSGSASAEFALVLPVLITLSLGSFGFMTLMSATSGLHFATEEAARCAAIKKTVCTSASTTQTYAKGQYKGPKITSLSFALTTPSCGQRVAATGSVVFATGLHKFTVPVSATACYPTQ